MEASLHHMTLSKVDTQATELCSEPAGTHFLNDSFLPCCTMSHRQAVSEANYKPKAGFENHISKPRDLRRRRCGMRC